MKLNVKKLQKAGTLPLKQDYQFYKWQYNPELKKKIEAKAETNKPINTTSEFIYDFKTKRNVPNPNAKMGLEIVSPEFQLMTAGVGSLGTKAVSTVGKIGQTMLHGAGQGAMANMSNLSGSKQDLSGLATDVLGGAIIGGGLKGIGLGAKPTAKYALQKAEPYLMGDKKIPMMNVYKPKQEFWTPFKFKPNSEKYYRGIGEKGLEDALSSGVIRQAGFLSGVPKYKAVYYGGGPNGFNRALNYSKNIIVEVDKQSFPRELDINDLQSVLGHKATLRHIPISEVKILKKHWLKGYKEIDKPADFKSEINWGNWNKEIPENTKLIKEYNAIEQTTKANGTWMKNPDGSSFQGTPEQFVQQNSSNFKKAFPNGFDETYRGVLQANPILKETEGNAIFTANKELANGYGNRAIGQPMRNIIKSPNNTENGIYQLYYPKSKNSLYLDALGDDWAKIDLSDLKIKQQKLKQQLEQNKDVFEKYKDNNALLDMVSDRYNKTKSRYDRSIDLKDDRDLLRKNLQSDETYTDHLARYIEHNNIDNIKIKDINDGGYGDVTIVNHKPKNYLKSMVGNNGMFDMSNPNIYKGLIPAAGLYGLTQSKKQGGKLIPKGQTGLKTNYIEPFHHSPYNFLNKPIMQDFNYESAIPFIVESEGKKLDKQGNHIIYKDGKGIDTIGYGLTSKQYVSKGKINEDEARQGIRMHIDKEVLPHLKSKPYWNNLSDNQKTALTSYVYNIGSGAFNTKSPSLQKALSESNWEEAAKQMDFGYNDSKNPGLKTRRDKERSLFLKGNEKKFLK